jgi:hypothetical protein
LLEVFEKFRRSLKMWFRGKLSVLKIDSIRSLKVENVSKSYLMSTPSKLREHETGGK